jgi:hypothetical protein
MRLFVAISVNSDGGSGRPCNNMVGLKLCGESNLLVLLAETFAIWAQNLQVTKSYFDRMKLIARQFCNETSKFIEICLQYMPMDLIPDIDDVTILLSNLQKNPSVRVAAYQLFDFFGDTTSAGTKSSENQCFVSAAHL